ncbi:T-cell immunoglobulin and mucin domain-containing protein 4-like [Notolabrus celidotus]|uniref:T-cell immunoglobulin and mucin domain-containing protein 4-like n=1 Tax=Notolabrus celidotus TaxID=1203425 RepID=UPI0014902D47|nr:T-cell immunoglobulin and mucin domain-containing protein 4-like [Notolabrus celidotus]
MRGLEYFLLSLLTQVSSGTVKVTGLLGSNVTLPCTYDTQTHGILSFCWGHGKVPRSKCSNTVLSSQDGAVDFRESHRYQLSGRLIDGDVSLTILNIQWSDAGVYGCRVEIPGWFNDYKVDTYLDVEKAPEEQLITEDLAFTTAGTQETLTTSTSTNEEVGDPKFERIMFATVKEEFKAFMSVGNIGRVAALLFLTVIIILVFIFRRELLPRRTLEHLDTSAAENIYESVPGCA